MKPGIAPSCDRDADAGFFYKTDEPSWQNMPALTHILYSQMILYDLFPVFKKGMKIA
ncbi:MAG: hypothetical protein J0I60_07035 [Nitrosospira sp.]|jgi:hypothetical protein|nr:hypothetical protein [Nitrosospira sp.]